MAQANPGEQDPNTQAGTRSHQNPGGQQQAKPIEEKHLADPAEGRPEPSANPERPPQHQPGFEAKQQAEADKAKPKGERGEHKAEEDHATPNKPRAHTARAKVHAKYATPKAKVRKHK